MQKMDDIVWTNDTYAGVFPAVHQLIQDETRRSILPFVISEAEQWAQEKAACHREIALRIKRISLSIPEDLRLGVERLHRHHYEISTRYTSASRACVWS